MIYYTNKKSPIVIRKQKPKKYKVVKTKAILPCKEDLSIGLRLSQRLDQIILAFRKRHDTGFKVITH